MQYRYTHPPLQPFDGEWPLGPSFQLAVPTTVEQAREQVQAFALLIQGAAVLGMPPQEIRKLIAYQSNLEQSIRDHQPSGKAIEMSGHYQEAHRTLRSF